MAMYVADEGIDVISAREAEDISLPLEFVKGVQNKMFDLLGADKYAFEHYPITANAHMWGITPEKFLTDAGLASVFYPTSISYTPEGNFSFVASMESEKYPFYST